METVSCLLNASNRVILGKTPTFRRSVLRLSLP